MKKFDYISILAGGKCKFNCDFCVGKNIRKDIKPHFSTKWESFIGCFADMTDLLSISGDTSDPSFVKESSKIPSIAKSFNKHLKVSLHTRNLNVIKTAKNAGYDSFVFSIDENFNKEMFNVLKNHKDENFDIRLSLVITDKNFHILDEWFKNFKDIFEFKMTIRPEVNSSKEKRWQSTFYNAFQNIGNENIDKSKNAIKMENGAIKLKDYPNIWYWDYNETNPKLNVRYLFSNGTISGNCQWEKLV